MIVKHNIFDIGGIVIKDDEYCLVRENRQLDNIIITSYLLYKDKSTKPFRHEMQDSVYMFVGGRGIFEIAKDLVYVTHNDIVLVPQNTYHKIINNGDIHMKFLMFREKV